MKLSCRLAFRRFLLSALVPTLAVFVLTGCNQHGANLNNNKLDAEELGYQEKFTGLIANASSSAYQIANGVHDAKKFANLGDANQEKACRQNMANALQNLQKLAQENLDKLKRTLPPEKMSPVHFQMIGYLEKTVGVTDPGKLAEDSQEFHKVAKALEQEINNRAVRQEAAQINLVLSFRLGGLPVHWNLRNGDFVVQTPLAIPGGNFLPAPAEHKGGVTKLIIRCNGKDRYFSLQRNFKIFVPTDYGVHIAHENGLMVIEVESKDGKQKSEADDTLPVPEPDAGKSPTTSKVEIAKADPPVKNVPETPKTGTILLNSKDPPTPNQMVFVFLDGESKMQWPAGSHSVEITADVGLRTIEVRIRRPGLSDFIFQKFQIKVEPGKKISKSF